MATQSQSAPVVLGPRRRRLVIGAVVAWVLVALFLALFGAHWALDMRVYRAAGAALLHHAAVYAERFTPNRLPFTYPPFALLVLSPLSFGPLPLVMGVWWSLNQLALIGLLYVAVRSALRITGREAIAVAVIGGLLATVLLEPLRANLDYANINLILMALVVVDLLRVRGATRGVLVGIAAAIKLTPLVFLVYFVLTGDRRSAARGVGTFVGAAVLSWAVLPSDFTQYWFHVALDPGVAGNVDISSNQSWNGLLHHTPFHAGTTGMVLWAVVSIATLGVGILAARRAVRVGRPVEALLALALTELLISPISWSHHWSWLVLVPVVLFTRWRRDRPLSIMLAVVLVTTILEPYRWRIGGWPQAVLSDSLTLLGAALLVTLAVRTHHDPDDRPQLVLGGRRWRWRWRWPVGVAWNRPS